MEDWLWVVIGILVFIMGVLVVKIYLLQKAAREIKEGFADRLITDTNTLIDISSHDKYMRELANTINIQLRKLRADRHRFQQGDMELKNAVSNISHDLRYIEVIRNRTEILKQLIEELFRYSVIITTEDDITKEAVEINRVLEESIAAFYVALNERKIIPSIKMPESKVICYLDGSALARVFSNLLNNAIKYSDGDLDIILSETGEIIFSNTASGLNEVQVGKLFDRFYTVEAARKSTGLGLAIAKTLVEQMNGTISAKYENNRLSICIDFRNHLLIINV